MSHESADLLLRGYHAFVAGDIDAIEEMLDPDVEWVPAGQSDAIVVSRDRVLEVVAERAAEGYHVVVDRAIGLADRVVVMTAGPATVKTVVPIDLPRPRRVEDIRLTPEFTELYRAIWDSLRVEVELTRARGARPAA